MSDSSSSTRKEEIRQALKETLLRHVPAPGVLETPIPGLQLVRREPDNSAERCFTRPVCSLVIQGKKHAVIGGIEHEFGEGQCFVVGVDMPSSSYVVSPDADRPFLSAYFALDREILLDLATHMRPEDRPKPDPEGRYVYVDEADEDYMENMLRLLELLDKPARIPIMAPLLLRELHYRLMMRPMSAALHGLFRAGSMYGQIVKAISIMKESIAAPLRVDNLAKLVNMSVSSLHRHFKSVTGFSPLQYHKNLRLYEAQRLMLMENQGAAAAAISVGYESPTQFSREYKRLFGEPPHRDVNRKRVSASS
ncbi:MAG: AraC family transcriptional regulator [Desulfovibrionaceae bacterium]|nr:AraC family transcriptional regulator [Desulfovibrionaceae bacterium]